MTNEQRWNTLEQRIRRLQRIAWSGWAVALVGAVAVFASGAAQQEQAKPRGLIAEVKDLLDRVDKLEASMNGLKAHVHVEQGQTTIVADRILIPKTRGSGFGDGTRDIGWNDIVAEFGTYQENNNLVSAGLFLYNLHDPNHIIAEFGTQWQNNRLHQAGMVLYNWKDPWDWRGQFTVVDTDGNVDGRLFANVVRIMLEDDSNKRNRRLWQRAISRDGRFYKAP